MIVLDASTVLELVLRTARGQNLLPRIMDPAESLAAPHLIDLEVAQVLRRYVLDNQLEPDRAAAALEDFLDLPIQRYPHAPFVRRIWEMRNNITAYDAAYVSLAEALQAPLITMDRRLAQAPGHSAEIELQ
jgi:predicted nucleic acid-binding protein